MELDDIIKVPDFISGPVSFDYYKVNHINIYMFGDYLGVDYEKCDNCFLDDYCDNMSNFIRKIQKQLKGTKGYIDLFLEEGEYKMYENKIISNLPKENLRVTVIPKGKKFELDFDVDFNRFQDQVNNFYNTNMYKIIDFYRKYIKLCIMSKDFSKDCQELVDKWSQNISYDEKILFYIFNNIINKKITDVKEHKIRSKVKNVLGEPSNHNDLIDKFIEYFFKNIGLAEIVSKREILESTINNLKVNDAVFIFKNMLDNFISNIDLILDKLFYILCVMDSKDTNSILKIACLDHNRKNLYARFFDRFYPKSSEINIDNTESRCLNIKPLSDLNFEYNYVDIETIQFDKLNSVKDLMNELEHGNHQNIEKIDSKKYLFYAKFENYKVIFKLTNFHDTISIDLLNKIGERNFDEVCIFSLIKNIGKDTYFNKSDIQIDFPEIGYYILENQMNVSVPGGYKNGYFCPSNFSMIKSLKECYGPENKKGTWIVKLKIQIMRALGCKFIELTDMAKYKNMSLFNDRLTRGNTTFSWYESFGYKPVYNLKKIYEAVQFLNIKRIINDTEYNVADSTINLKDFLRIINKESHEGNPHIIDEVLEFLSTLNEDVLISPVQTPIKIDFFAFRLEIYIDKSVDKTASMKKILSLIFSAINELKYYYYMIL